MVRNSGLLAVLNSLEGGLPRSRAAIDRRQEGPFRELLTAERSVRGIETARAAIGSGLAKEPPVGAPAANSPERQNFAALDRPDSSLPKAAAKYVPFEKGIPAYDIERINSQQNARNEAFREWIDAISATLAGMGIQPEVTLVQHPTNWYVQPVRATLTFNRDGADVSCSLSLYHYDAWQGRDAAKFALSMGTVPEVES